MQAPQNLIPRGRGRGGRGRGFYRVLPSIEQDKAYDPPQPSSVLPLADLQSQFCDEVSSGLQHLQLGSESGAKKEDEENMGEKGEACQCLTNFVKLRRVGAKSVFEYRLSFNPPLESTRLKKTIVQQLENVVGPVTLFDGETLYLPIKLLNAQQECKVPHPNNEAAEVSIMIKFIQERVDEFEFVQFYNILFQKIMLKLGYLEIRRGFYKVSNVREIHRAKLEIWPGIIPTVQVKDDGLMVMIDFPSRVLRTETIHDFYLDLRKKEEDDQKFRKIFLEFVIGKIVVCNYSRQCHKIDDVVFDQNPSNSFNYRDKWVTYCKYFKMQYNIDIKDATQPLLLSRIKPQKVCNPSISTEAVRVICLIPELCHLTGLTSEQRADRELVSEISAITRLNPRLKANAMEQLLKEITETPIAKEFLESWGLKLDTELVTTIGRKIPPPALSFYENSEPRIVQPNFSREASKSCVHPMPVNKFIVICTGRDHSATEHFLKEYEHACARLGIRVRTNGEIVKVNNHGNTLNQFVRALEKSCTEEVQFVIAVMPTHRDDLYRAVKKFCCSVRPIPSQCILAKNLRQPKIIKKIVVNICLQINCKMGGSLWSLRMPFTEKIMVIGMDAAHDPTRKNPSVIALVATLNQKCTLHFSRCSLQPVHQEICTSLRVMFKDALDAYRKYNAGELPDKIVFYRDGGSAGTFQTLKDYEVDICVKVLEEETLGSEKVTNFSYLCVAKRIPQRILLMSEGRTITNPRSGTVLDHTITEPGRYDFYIVSQQVREGTVNPTHYSVLHETERTKPDDMQRLAYAMTYMYYNFAGSIKVPSVIQYSHKLGQLVSRIQEIPNRNICHTLYFL